MSEEDCTVGGDVRGNHHPALPPSDDEGETGVDEASGGIRPPPGFNKEVVDTSGRPPFTRRYIIIGALMSVLCDQ